MRKYKRWIHIISKVSYSKTRFKGWEQACATLILWCYSQYKLQYFLHIVLVTTYIGEISIVKSRYLDQVFRPIWVSGRLYFLLSVVGVLRKWPICYVQSLLEKYPCVSMQGTQTAVAISQLISDERLTCV